jgi:hypothetical protein
MINNRRTASRGKNEATYSMTGNGAVKRIRNPHPHDVLSGRGGGINSHIGNKTFREWVRERKEPYNLAGSKAEKARVANEVIELVQALDPPGRFLQRDSSSTAGVSWWVEVDDIRALAKTSQALREGAPQIRAAHKDDIDDTKQKKSRRKKSSSAPAQSSTPSSTQAPLVMQGVHGDPSSSSYSLPHALPAAPFQPTGRSTTTEKALESLKKNVQEAKSLAEQQGDAGKRSIDHIVAPLMSNKEFDDNYSRPMKKVRMEDNNSNDPINNSNDPMGFSATADTPPLTSATTQVMATMLPMNDLPPQMKMKKPNANKKGLSRTHSLALSDLSSGDLSAIEDDFVNPFADESELDVNIVLNKPTSSAGTPKLRNLSSSGTNDWNKPDNKNLGGRHRTSLGSLSTRYVSHFAPSSPHLLFDSKSAECFCDCASPLVEGNACICGDLADHLLHRSDGRSLSLKDLFNLSILSLVKL